MMLIVREETETPIWTCDQCGETRGTFRIDEVTGRVECLRHLPNGDRRARRK